MHCRARVRGRDYARVGRAWSRATVAVSDRMAPIAIPSQKVREPEAMPRIWAMVLELGIDSDTPWLAEKEPVVSHAASQAFPGVRSLATALPRRDPWLPVGSSRANCGEQQCRWVRRALRQSESSPRELPHSEKKGTSVGCNMNLHNVNSLRKVPVHPKAVRFLSCEPLLEDIADGLSLDRIGWLIAG